MNVESELRKRFEKAVNKIIDPPVLIGPKWLRPGPGEGQFQFVGTLKIAKATGRKAQRIASLLSRTLRLGDLDLRIKTSPTGVMTLSPAPRAKKGPGKADKADKPGKKPKAPAKAKPAKPPAKAKKPKASGSK